MSRLLALVLALACILALPSFSETKPIITVLDFKTDGVSEKEMRSIIELLSSALFNTQKFQVIDVTQRENLLKEVEFSASECSDESCQLKIGQMLSAELIVVGNIGKVGTRFLMSAKILETETARTRSAADGIYTSLDALVDALPALARKLGGVEEKTAEASPAPAAAPKPAEKAEAAPAATPRPAEPVAPARKPDLKLVGGIAAIAGGVAAGGVGGWLIYTAATAGKAAVDAAQAAYTATTEEDAASNWDALLAAVSDMKTKLYAGIGSAGAGLLLGGLGTTLLLLPPKPPSAAPSVSLMLVPGRESALLSFSVRY